MAPHRFGLHALAAVLMLYSAAFSAAAEEAPPASLPPSEQAPPQRPEEKTAPAVEGEEPRHEVRETVEVQSRADAMVGIADTASEGVVGRLDLAERPLLRPGELLETVPGVVITQHSGGGKANQYFLRGFNLDHGTDFRVTVGGIPVNLSTHAHGQGYTDLNFLIPELVETIRYRKGPYYAEEGDFSAAGAVRLDYVRRLPEALVQVAGGGLGYRRLLAADSFALAGGELLGAIEAAGSDGPWRRDDDLERANALVRYSRGDDDAGFDVTLLGYEGSWNATDQVPESAVAEGLLGRFDTLDPTCGGESRRWSFAAAGRRARGSALERASAYLLYYDLDLFSNFTYFLDDPKNGDQFEQADRRWAGGFQAARERAASWRGRPASVTLGLEARLDAIDNGLHHTAGRQRLETLRHDDVLQGVGGLYAEARLAPRRWLRLQGGLRLDGYWTEVESDRAENSGTRAAALLSPKLSLVLGPWRSTELYLSAGSGFHSNDARGATLRVDPRTGESAERVDPLVRARGVDLGVRTEALAGLNTALTFFALELDSELLFVGDAGGTEATRPSRRVGLELANFWQPRPWLRLDVDLSLARARFTDSDPAGDEIPGAIERVVSAGLAFEELRGFSGGLRLRHFGPRPLVEDGGVESADSTLVYLQAGYRLASGLRLGLEVYNLFDSRVSDIDYFYESRLRPDLPPREDVHFHPAEPRSLRLVLEWRPTARSSAPPARSPRRSPGPPSGSRP
jgi:hypothetical protein